MQSLFNRSSQRLVQPKTCISKENTSTHRSLSMIKPVHICSCCSYVLLRHLSAGSIYWQCSHCYQAMPAFSANYSP